MAATLGAFEPVGGALAMKSSPRSRRLASPIPLFFLLAALMPADRAPAQPGGPAMVTVAPVQRQTIEQELRLSGTMRPRRYSRVSAEVAGKALEVSADAGDFVQEGDPLLRLETRPTELMLAEATANFRLRQAELAELKAGSRSEDIAMYQAELENSRARLSLAESELQRVETLLERRAVSRGDFDKVKAEADRSRAEVPSARPNWVAPSRALAKRKFWPRKLRWKPPPLGRISCATLWTATSSGRRSRAWSGRK
jgi:multidrug efflux pump subunit AcrA (membrane-fusion protein)